LNLLKRNTSLSSWMPYLHCKFSAEFTLTEISKLRETTYVCVWSGESVLQVAEKVKPANRNTHTHTHTHTHSLTNILPFPPWCLRKHLMKHLNQP